MLKFEEICWIPLFTENEINYELLSSLMHTTLLLGMNETEKYNILAQTVFIMCCLKSSILYCVSWIKYTF